MAGVRQQASFLLANTAALSSRGVLSHCQPCSVFLTSKRHKSGGQLTAYKRGTGGRSSFSGVVATVFGASGFLGRYVVNQLAKIGSQVIIPYRCPEYDVDPLKVCGDLGQILFTPFNLKDEDSIRKSVKHSNVVINLIGRDFPTKNFSFEDVHVDGAARLARLSAEAGVERFIHISAMNASEIQYTAFGKKSRFVESKGQGELAVRAEFPDAIIMRPADMWGDEDRFVNYWAKHWRKHFEMMPLWKQGKHTIRQPVDVVNVAQGIAKAAIEKGMQGTTIECVGPSSHYLYDMIQYFSDEMRLGHTNVIPLVPSFLAKVKICETCFPATPPLTTDKLIREAYTDILTGCPTLEDVGVQLNPFSEGMRYQLKVHRSGRDYAESVNEIADAKPPPTAAEVAASKRMIY